LSNWSNFKKIAALSLVFALVMGFGLTGELAAEEDVPYGGYLDAIVGIEEADSAAAVTRMEAGEIHIHAETLTDPDLLERVQDDESIQYVENFGSYGELTINPAGTPEEPYFEETGELNPFAVPRMREALNWLVDRDYIADELYGGLAAPKYTLLGTAFTDYARHIETVREIEVEYSHNPEKAAEIIEEEMLALGAEMDDGLWHYDGEPVEVGTLIRIEDERHDVGDYVSDLLEDQGFVVTRNYVTAAEASPIWMTGNPHAGEWSIYTGGWISTVVSRDEGPDFDFFFTERGLGTPLYMEYAPPEEADEVYHRLAIRDFEDMDERAALFEEALWYSSENAKRIWTDDSLSFSPHREEITLAHDFAGGISGSWLWGHTVRYEDEIGGEITVSMPSILSEPWNPTHGSNWIFDMMFIRATSEAGYMFDPYTGLHYPNQFESAEVYIREGLPVDQTLDWVELEFVAEEENTVPEDAWYDWDAEAQEFTTVGEEFDELPTANRRVVTTYPEDHGITWHDGSEFSLADMVWFLILDLDRAQEESEIFDSATVPDYESFMDTFKGVRILDDDPITIEWYSDLYYLDAEMYIPSLFPLWDQGSGAWHNMAVAFQAEASGNVAHTADKADAEDIEWANYIGGPSLEYLEEELEWMTEENYIPYENTLGEFISEEEAQQRYENLNYWFEEQNHFWLGTGPYHLDVVHPVEGIVEMARFEDYNHPADRWEIFADPIIPEIGVSGPGSIFVGDAEIFDVEIEFEGEAFASENILETSYLLFDHNNNLVASGELSEVEEGHWQVELEEEETAALTTGPSRLEVIVSPLTVASPSIQTFEFVAIEQ